MDRNIRHDESQVKPLPVYNQILNEAVAKKARELIPEGELSWYAEYVFGVPAATLSVYLNGSRSFPGWLVVAVDKAFKAPHLIGILTDAEASGPPVHRPLDPRSLEKLFVLALREEGHFNSMLAQGIVDHFDGADELDQLDRELGKLSHFLGAMHERVHALRVKAS